LTARDSRENYRAELWEVLVSATLALLMILSMVLVALFFVIHEQVTDRRRDREFEQKLAVWRVRLHGRYRGRAARVTD
jgi:Mn2+/Fe2+ NRAMP family transporter